MQKKSSDNPALGAIAAGQVYPLPEFQRITGLGEAAMRTARQRGLHVSYVGNRGFIRGDDFLNFLEKLSNKSDH